MKTSYTRTKRSEEWVAWRDLSIDALQVFTEAAKDSQSVVESEITRTSPAGHGGRAAFKAGIHKNFIDLRKSKKCEKKIENFHFFRKSENFRES